VYANNRVLKLKDYVKRHPEVVVIDRMEGVRILMDRYRQYKLVDDSDLAREGNYRVINNPYFAFLNC